ncbi:hypothetical protein SDRG_08730 [Saprolegnia diclina VS20]|uniref:Uncharacterized protein n=1 Tax=Saprolegnia diclina (strain VS20) TaxID=1156394 RepID=T0QIR7_SAPDV|nr:hypothetical protein SDRG_08730 [Saprolegnia diclina VS20]EQC33625.1 hypothetical protein SDRG_08730 [Saprolegnia diclina VS20]|eukprot:XP_008612848.1 hypothetical protein SDRG_08730 [Saprolegnia diclina VS20]
MEESKLVALHDMLQRLRPKGKSGGLGSGGSFGLKSHGPRDDGLPNNETVEDEEEEVVKPKKAKKAKKSA